MGVRQDVRKLQPLLDRAKGKVGLKDTRKKLKKAIQYLVSTGRGRRMISLTRNRFRAATRSKPSKAARQKMSTKGFTTFMKRKELCQLVHVESVTPAMELASLPRVCLLSLTMPPVLTLNTPATVPWASLTEEQSSG